MKLAKSTQEEIKHINDLLKECSWLQDELKQNELEDADLDDFELLKDYNKKDAAEFLGSLVSEIKGLYWQKALFNLTTLLDNCADKTLDYLDFNPEIKAGQEAITLLRKMNDFIKKSPIHSIGQNGTFHLRIIELLEKIPIEETITTPPKQ